MTKPRSTKQALLMSILALVMCLSMLVGSTMAWFTDSVTSTGNKIQAGTLKLDLEMYNTENGKYESIKESKAPIFNHDKWEPGYTDVKLLKVENEGTLALKWYAKFVSTNEVTALADVIDVYVRPSATELTMPGRDLDGYTKVGTVRQFVNTIETTTYGTLNGGTSAYLGIALKMQETAGNDYQGLTIGAFDIMILATQTTVESDSFGPDYDANATYPTVVLPPKNISAETTEELLDVLDNVTEEVVINAEGVVIEHSEQFFNISGGVTLKGATIDTSSRGGSYIVLEEGASSTVVFEECTFNRSESGANIVAIDMDDEEARIVFNNCTFEGPVMPNSVENANGTIEFNNCTFKITTAGFPQAGYVNCMGGTHIFNNCTFDFTGGNTMGSNQYVRWNAVNSYSESSYSTSVILNGCTFINCSTQRYGSNSTLVRQ